MQALLSFEKAPPFSAPVRFFLTAPWFVVLAGGVLGVFGSDAFSSRWHPAALAITHLLTLGFMAQVMIGALIQVLPVVAGANLASPLHLARWVHGGLLLGTLLLVLGFLGWVACLLLAVIILGGAGAAFCLAMGRALLPVPDTSPTILGLKLAWFGLLVTLSLGVTLALGLGRGWALPFVVLTDVHAAWGLAAWVGCLVVALAYVVVPMFQLTPGYRARLGWGWPAAVLLACVALSAAAWWSLGVLGQFAQAVLALAGLLFAGVTLRLQSQRKRARVDTTLRYWQLGMWSLAGAMGMLLASAVWPSLADQSAWLAVFGILLGIGGILSVICGMLIKIVPFLAWLHVQNLGQQRVMAPAMTHFLGDAEARRQWWAHLVALGVLLLAALAGEAAGGALSHLAGLTLAASGALLGLNLWRALGRYRVSARRVAAECAAQVGP